MKRVFSRLFVLVFLIPVSSHAANFFRGPVVSSLGGSGRGGITGPESAFINPALLPLVKEFEFGAIFRDGDAAAGQHHWGWALGAVDDSEDAFFPASLHYVRTRDTGRAGGPADGEAWHVAAAYLINDQLSVGATGYRLEHKVKGDPRRTQWNYGLGFVYLINVDFAVGYTIENIAQPGGDVPMGLREDMEQGLGLFYRISEIATFRLDVTRNERFNPDKKMTYMVGIESATSQFGVFRAGYRREEQSDQKVWTAGFGFKGPRLRVNYGFEKNQEGSSGALHSVDMQVPF